MIGENVTVYLNGELVVDNVRMDNYWDRSIPIFEEGTIELQAHGNELAFRDVYVKEIDTQSIGLTQQEKEEGFVSLFNGKNLDGWQGNLTDYYAEDGILVVNPKMGGRGNLFTADEYSDFNFRFEFKLTPGANNGLGIRAPLEGDAAYMGMELQILDNTAPYLCQAARIPVPRISLRRNCSQKRLPESCWRMEHRGGYRKRFKHKNYSEWR